MLREPAEIRIGDHGQVELPMSLLVEAGLMPGTELLAFSDGDGRIVLRRVEDAVRDLLANELCDGGRNLSPDREVKLHWFEEVLGHFADQGASDASWSAAVRIDGAARATSWGADHPVGHATA
ncbi:AbrB/MazE/SpoVT family DNA-binding domain-containing protein [Streptomyces xiamenensis]|uniref:AbrB/MazE/SpoVT family DNA-binding domain-containing protein n=1 Tax=Streptomyces xiamenensis TaxID=408015 RepID=UPI0036EBFB09